MTFQHQLWLSHHFCQQVLTTGLSLGHGGHRRMGASATTRPIGKCMEQAPISGDAVFLTSELAK